MQWGKYQFGPLLRAHWNYYVANEPELCNCILSHRVAIPMRINKIKRNYGKQLRKRAEQISCSREQIQKQPNETLLIFYVQRTKTWQESDFKQNNQGNKYQIEFCGAIIWWKWTIFSSLNQWKGKVMSDASWQLYTCANSIIILEHYLATFIMDPNRFLLKHFSYPPF